MKKMKKIISILLIAVMMMAMSVTAFADNNDGSITITNATVDETYSVYKLLDVSYNTTTGSYVYTIDSSSAWYSFFYIN
ncbi:MAG: hypothetical protein LUE14_06185 [Clostridiales bacterium]|nr:hypothetical protein [Clostridiales bacterium]